MYRKRVRIYQKNILDCCRFLGTYDERVLELWVSLDCAGQLSRLPLHSTLLTLSYSSKINSYLYHQRVSPPLKKMPWHVISGQCCPSSRVWQPSADSCGSLAPFLFEFKLSGSRVTALCWQSWWPKKAITISRGLSHPTRSLSRIVCRGQERPKCRKGTLRPDFQAKTRPRTFLKPMSPQDTGRQLWGNPGIVSWRHFRDK